MDKYIEICIFKNWSLKLKFKILNPSLAQV